MNLERAKAICSDIMGCEIDNGQLLSSIQAISTMYVAGYYPERKEDIKSLAEWAIKNIIPTNGMNL